MKGRPLKSFLAEGLQQDRVEPCGVCSALGQERGTGALLDQLLWLLPLHRPTHTTSLLGFQWPMLRACSTVGIAQNPLVLP